MLKVLLFLWQLPQNIIGFIISRFSIYKFVYTRDVEENKKVRAYYVKNFFHSGVSLGDFIILDEEYWHIVHIQTLKHEHGHQKQSQILGWLYLIIIGIPSILGNLWDRVFHKNWPTLDREAWYYKQPWEAWADKLGKVNRWD
ncbi:MAG: hypothetical protein J6T31_07120 [Methanobrevibacter sp.]|nr:hypothetical protein [Methanobrevibacter sp.]